MDNDQDSSSHNESNLTLPEEHQLKRSKNQSKDNTNDLKQTDENGINADKSINTSSEFNDLDENKSKNKIDTDKDSSENNIESNSKHNSKE